MRAGTPSHLLDSYYMIYCEQAFNDFCDRHWPCSFRIRESRCTNVYFGHNDTKGHQNTRGKVIATGDYLPSFHYNNDLSKWIQCLETEIDKIEQARASSRPGLKADDVSLALHARNVQNFYRNIGLASNFISNYTCFCCLREVPLHPLTCGHVLCTPCVHSYGMPRGPGLIDILQCPICLPGEPQPQPTVIHLKPTLAGVRVLCLDGYTYQSLAMLISSS